MNKFFWARLVSFGLLGLISDPQISSKLQNEINGPKGLEKHAQLFFCRTGICRTQDIFLQAIGTKTRTVRKSDYTPALALPKHMAGLLDEKC